MYQQFYENDTVVVSDAHQYLLDHHQEFDFIWSSPPCPTHSRANTALYGWGVVRYPDMSLWQEIIWLRKFFKKPWVVENVVPYYEPLIKPTVSIDRHYFWSNFDIEPLEVKREHDVSRATKEKLAAYHGIELPEGTKEQRKLLRNCVTPEVGLHVLKSAYSVQ